MGNYRLETKKISQKIKGLYDKGVDIDIITQHMLLEHGVSASTVRKNIKIFEAAERKFDKALKHKVSEDEKK